MFCSLKRSFVSSSRFSLTYFSIVRHLSSHSHFPISTPRSSPHHSLLFQSTFPFSSFSLSRRFSSSSSLSKGKREPEKNTLIDFTDQEGERKIGLLTNVKGKLLVQHLKREKIPKREEQKEKREEEWITETQINFRFPGKSHKTWDSPLSPLSPLSQNSFLVLDQKISLDRNRKEKIGKEERKERFNVKDLLRFQEIQKEVETIPPSQVQLACDLLLKKGARDVNPSSLKREVLNFFPKPKHLSHFEEDFFCYEILLNFPDCFQRLNGANFKCLSEEEKELEKERMREEREREREEKLFIQKMQRNLQDHSSFEETKYSKILDSLISSALLGLDQKKEILVRGPVATLYNKIVKEEREGRERGDDEMNESVTSRDICDLLMNVGILRVSNVYQTFLDRKFGVISEKAIESAKKLITEEPDHLSHLRQDLSSMTCFALDVTLSGVCDDAVSYQIESDGKEWVYVHIADPARYIPLGSSVDLSARHRGFHIVSPTLLHPLHPKMINDACSLSNGKKNCALTIAFCFNRKTGNLSEWKIFPSIIQKIHHIYADAELIEYGVAAEKENKSWTYELSKADCQALGSLLALSNRVQSLRSKETNGRETLKPIVLENLWACTKVVAELLGVRDQYSLDLLRVTAPLRRYPDFLLHHFIHSKLLELDTNSCTQTNTPKGFLSSKTYSTTEKMGSEFLKTFAAVSESFGTKKKILSDIFAANHRFIALSQWEFEQAMKGELKLSGEIFEGAQLVHIKTKDGKTISGTLLTSSPKKSRKRRGREREGEGYRGEVLISEVDAYRGRLICVPKKRGK